MKEIFYLKQIPDTQVESVNPIIWTDYIAGRLMASQKLIVLIEEFYFENWVMQDIFDRAIRTMFLRRKLRLIEARRIKYPATADGRRRFIKDSLKPKYQIKFWYGIAILIGIAGLILSLILCFKGIDFPGMFLVALLSLLIFYFGIQGIERRPEWKHFGL